MKQAIWFAVRGGVVVGLMLALAGIAPQAVAAGPIGTYYLTAGDQGMNWAVEGPSIVLQHVQNCVPGFCDAPYGEYAIALDPGHVRTLGNGSLFQGTVLPGSEYGYDLIPTSVKIPYPVDTAHFYDGTQNGNRNYSVDFGTGDVYSFDTNWADPQKLCSLNSFGYLGITYDSSNDSLWISTFYGTTVANYTLTCDLKSSFETPFDEITALAMDVDHTLWMGSQETWGTFYHFSTAGKSLGTVSYADLSNQNTLGGEIVNPSNAPNCVQPPNTTMVAWYAFDELTGTLSANLATANLGIQHHGPLGIAGGEVYGAASFNGKDQYIESPSSIATNFGPAHDAAFCSSTANTNREGDYSSCRGNFSIDTWVKVGPSPSTTVMTIIDKRGTTSNGALYGYHLVVYNGTLVLQLADGGFTNYGSPTLTPAINNGQWHHIAVTVDRLSSTGITWYHNGIKIGSGNPTNRPGSLVNTSPLRIGTRTAASPLTGWLNGALDELEIYNRVLSPEEVFDIYYARSSGKCKPPSQLVTAQPDLTEVER